MTSGRGTEWNGKGSTGLFFPAIFAIIFSMAIIIKGAQIVDGTGKPPVAADVLIKGVRISAIGDFSSKKADEVIDARGTGAFLTPGFIDVNTDSDHYLSIFTNPEQENFLLQGVTTIIGGNCGSSLAPLIKGTLESIRKWTDINLINVNWQSVDELLAELEKIRLGVNFGTLIGHSTIRRGLLGETLRDLSAEELRVIKNLAEKGMEEGAFGLSTGLSYAHAKMTPYFEIKTLTEAIAKYKGVYATHLRNERSKIARSVEETIKVAKENGLKTEISHLRPIIGFEREFEEAVKLIDESLTDADVTFDVYPFDSSVVPIYTLLPSWARHGNLEKMADSLDTAAIRERIISEMPKLTGEEITIAAAPKNEFLIGKTLKEFSENHGLPPLEGAIRLMRVTKLRAVIFYRNVNFDYLKKSFGHERCIVASNGGIMPAGRAGIAAEKVLNHERSYDTFPKFLEIISRDNQMPIEKAVNKITGLPARKFGIRDRGIVAEGKYADLTLVCNNKISAVIVNGKIAVKNGEFQNISAGNVLRRK